MNNILFALPEIYLALAGMIVLLQAAWGGNERLGLVWAMSVAALAVTVVLVGGQIAEGSAMNDMFAVGAFQRYAKIAVLIASGAAIGLSLDYWRRGDQGRAEYPVLALFATLGMMLMLSANDMIALYLGLEMQNLPLYVMVAFRRDRLRSSEAALKYFTLGAMSSALLLFGLSYIFGVTGATGFDGIAGFIAAQGSEGLPMGLSIGVAFALAGLAFKVSAVPFHMWTPDVYEGAPTPVTAFLAAAPKIAAMGLLAVVLAHPLIGAAAVWKPILIALALLSMALGALAGLRQTRIKRLIAYSAIANIGTMLIGLVLIGGAAGSSGVAGVLIYLSVYALGTLTLFAGLLCLRKKGESMGEIADLAGLSKDHPALALALAVALFSLAGVPPLAGFFGKYFVLLAAVQGGMAWLAVLGVLASVIAAAYYLRIVKVMYFDERKCLALERGGGRLMKGMLGVLAALLAAFVLYPTPLIEAAQAAAQGLLAP